MSSSKSAVLIQEEPVAGDSKTRLASKDVGINKGYVGVRRIKTPKPRHPLSFGGKSSTDIESEDIDDDVKDADFLTVTDSINDRILLHDIVETRMEMRSSMEDVDLVRAIEKAADTTADPQIHRTIEHKIALSESHKFVQINTDTGHIFFSDLNRDDETAATKAAAAEFSSSSISSKSSSISRGLLSISLLNRIYKSKIRMRNVSKFDLPQIIELESDAYPSDEAASAESIYYRFIFAAPFFKVFENTRNGEIIGFMNATVFKGDLLTHDVFTNHAWALIQRDEYGSNGSEELKEDSQNNQEQMMIQLLIDSSRYNLCIHSVVIRSDLRRQGFGKLMVEQYMNYVRSHFSARSCDRIDETFTLRSIRLLCKEHLIRFYQQAGHFILRGPSDIVHGKDPWFEMIVQL